MLRSRLANIFFIVFVDLLGFGLILPLLPYYAEEFGATPTLVGLLVASNAAANLIGAPLLGRLSDRYGRRPVLIASISSTLAGFLILGFANSLRMLFLARILDGLIGGNISVAQAYITDITNEDNRARGLGLIGAAFGLGFIIGPALGGSLSRYGYAVPAFAAAGLAALNLTGVALWLPESLKLEDRTSNAKQPPAINLRSMLEALRRPVVGPLLHTRLFFAFAFSLFQTIFALYAQYRLALDAQATGLILAYVGLLSVLVQGVAMGRLTRRFSEPVLIFSATAMMSAGLLAWAWTPNVLTLLIVLIPLALSGGILNTVINSSLSKAVSMDEIGGTLGLSSALENLTRVFSPSAGGLLLDVVGTWAPGLLGGLIMAWLASFVWRHIIRPHKAALSNRPLRPEAQDPQ